MENSPAGSAASKTNIVEKLAEKFGLAAKAATIFSDPIERHGTTIIPVAKVAYGFGAGAGNIAADESTGGGGGGGGGMAIVPVGFIELKDGSSRFRVIRDPQNAVKLIVVSGLVGVLLVRSVAKLLHK